MDEGLPTPLVRPRRGRWLGGVCAGLATRRQVAPARVRAGFALASVFLGLGVLVYVAAWLILPGESEDGVTPGQRGIVLLAQAGGALIALATLAGIGTVATVFGFGWVVVALAAAILVGVLAGWAKFGPAWALLPVGALVLPSAALAVGGVRLDPNTTERVLVPSTEPELYADLREQKAGLGAITLDLRRMAWPTSGTSEIELDAGVRRTLIALPHELCVHVEVNQQEPPSLLRFGSALLGEGNLASPTPVVFGQYGALTDQEAAQRNHRQAEQPGATLVVNYSTLGGELIVRDYPDDVSPRYQPDWPGYTVYPEERPDTTGLSSAEATRVISEWEERFATQSIDQARVERLMSGPCAKPLEVEQPKNKRKRKR